MGRYWAADVVGADRLPRSCAHKHKNLAAARQCGGDDAQGVGLWESGGGMHQRVLTVADDDTVSITGTARGQLLETSGTAVSVRIDID